MKPIRVALVDDHMLVRAGVKSLLDGAADIEVVGEADTAEKAIDLVRRARPDVVLLDLQLPGANGLSLFCDLVELGTGARIVVLSAFLNGQLLRTCLGAGAYGYITKESVDPRLADMVRRVMVGE